MTLLVPAIKVHLISRGECEPNLIQFLLESVDMGQVIYLQYPIKATVVTIWTLTLTTLILAKSRSKPFWKWHRYHSHLFPACDSGTWWHGDREQGRSLWVRAHLGWESLRQSGQRKYLLIFSCLQGPSTLGEGITKIGLAPRWALSKQEQIQSK